MLLMSDALWHGLIGAGSIAMMYAIYYCYKGIRRLIKNPEMLSHSFDSFKWRIARFRKERAERQMKSGRDIGLKDKQKGPSHISLPGWTKKALIGLCVVACLAGSGYGIYRLLDDVIIPKRNAIKDMR